MHGFNAVLVVLGISFFTNEANSAPGSQPPPLIYFKDGTIGVNFLGFHAAAGLKGIANGGGLHAEAGTPYGQRAAAGLGGALSQDGSVAGNLYAGATAGGNVKAAAGLGGAVVGGDSPRVAGGLYSASSAGAAKAGSSIAGGISNDVSYNVIEKIADVEPVKPRTVKTKYVTYNAAGPPASGGSNAGGVSFLSTFFAPQPQQQESPSSSSSIGQRTFFDDIFNIPISTLGAVSRFLSNAVPKPTAIEVEKTITSH